MKLAPAFAAGGGRLVDADCRSTVCRIETVHDNPSGANDYGQRLVLPGSRPWNGALLIAAPEGETAQVAPGGKRLVAYLFREGVSPQLD